MMKMYNKFEMKRLRIIKLIMAESKEELQAKIAKLEEMSMAVNKEKAEGRISEKKEKCVCACMHV